jgi:hypothetical protein
VRGGHESSCSSSVRRAQSTPFERSREPMPRLRSAGCLDFARHERVRWRCR